MPTTIMTPGSKAYHQVNVEVLLLCSKRPYTTIPKDQIPNLQENIRGIIDFFVSKKVELDLLLSGVAVPISGHLYHQPFWKWLEKVDKKLRDAAFDLAHAVVTTWPESLEPIASSQKSFVLEKISNRKKDFESKLHSSVLRANTPSSVPDAKVPEVKITIEESHARFCSVPEQDLYDFMRWRLPKTPHSSGLENIQDLLLGHTTCTELEEIHQNQPWVIKGLKCSNIREGVLSGQITIKQLCRLKKDQIKELQHKYRVDMLGSKVRAFLDYNNPEDIAQLKKDKETEEKDTNKASSPLSPVEALGQDDETDESVLKALENAQLKAEAREASLLNQVGNFYHSRRNYDKAAFFQQGAATLYEKLVCQNKKYKRHAANNAYNLGESLFKNFKQGNDDCLIPALNSLTEANEFFNKSPDNLDDKHKARLKEHLTELGNEFSKFINRPVVL